MVLPESLKSAGTETSAKQITYLRVDPSEWMKWCDVAGWWKMRGETANKSKRWSDKSKICEQKNFDASSAVSRWWKMARFPTMLCVLRMRLRIREYKCDFQMTRTSADWSTREEAPLPTRRVRRRCNRVQTQFQRVHTRFYTTPSDGRGINTLSRRRKSIIFVRTNRQSHVSSSFNLVFYNLWYFPYMPGKSK